MTIRTTLMAGIAATAFGFSALTANAVPVLNGGWASDIVFTSEASDSSPYVFTLLGDAWFRITDAFIVGDTLTVWNTGELIPFLTTSLQGFAAGFGDNATADDAWTSVSWGSAEVLLTAGSYSLEIFSDGAGGFPSGFFARLDPVSDVVAPVPLPAALPLLVGGVAALAFVRRKKRAN